MSAFPVDDVFHRGAPGPNLPFLSNPFLPDALVAHQGSVPLIPERLKQIINKYA
jgi:hypothetical protein